MHNSLTMQSAHIPHIYSLPKLPKKVFLKWWTWERKSDDKNYSDSESFGSQFLSLGALCIVCDSKPFLSSCDIMHSD